ncbi:hypothetical protein J421_4639 (plasmid) [Gemmatirosa kalamazoonensis]|uniref:Lipoprotein n=1 Tax=Gemmatirosa kalamazoonensis TaxID=861299 RepID=W0RM81_9BACT|nr:hypothetical protein [Gemmatirosa kalamazoonensis]AHG92106.1 hypothetical protein J421_4571 [Gemmatirosa kalamazoonensis]AHG92174.1 hypothetical protein J421_4639 [Gemmatirosa kalamazoonensis]
MRDLKWCAVSLLIVGAAACKGADRGPDRQKVTAAQPVDTNPPGTRWTIDSTVDELTRAVSYELNARPVESSEPHGSITSTVDIRWRCGPRDPVASAGAAFDMALLDSPNVTVQPGGRPARYETWRRSGRFIVADPPLADSLVVDLHVTDTTIVRFEALGRPAYVHLPARGFPEAWRDWVARCDRGGTVRKIVLPRIGRAVSRVQQAASR